MKQIILTLIFMMGLTMCWGQETVSDSTSKKKDEHSLSIYFEVKDYLSNIGVDTMTVLVLNAADSVFVDSAHVELYKHDDERYSSAYFDLKKTGDYLIRVDAEGYKTRFVPFSIKRFHKHEIYRQLKPVYLQRLPKKKTSTFLDGNMLDEIVVKASKVKFYHDGDTLVFDADAFELAEGSMLDALIKQLPGVELKSGGEITVNGRKVEELLLNGKELMGEDKRMMLENLPSFTVKRVKAYDRTPKEYLGTRKEKQVQKQLVMDVRLKKEYSQGWIANAELGGGLPYRKNAYGKYDKKFLGRLFGMHYSDRSRLNLYANANNLNDNRQPGGEGEWSPLQQSTGLLTTYDMGAGYRYDTKDDNLNYNGDLRLTYNETTNEQHGTGATFLEGGDTYNGSFSRSQNYNFSVSSYNQLTFSERTNLWNLFKTAYLTFHPQFSYNKWNRNGNSASATLAEDVLSGMGKAWLDSIMAPQSGEILRRYAINRNLNTSKGNGHSVSTDLAFNASVTPLYNDRMYISTNGSYGISDQLSPSFNHYQVDYYRSQTEADRRNQYTDATNTSHHAQAGASFNYTLDKKYHHSIGANYNLNYTSSRNRNYLYLLNKLEGWKSDERALGELPSTELLGRAIDAGNSTRSHSRTLTQEPRFSYSYSIYNDTTHQMFNIDAGVGLPMQHERMDYQKGSVDTLLTRNTCFLEPQVNVWFSNYKRQTSFSFNYSSRKSAPSLTNLINVRDDSNPLYITNGNPNLKNTLNHNFGMYFNNTWKERYQMNVNVNSTITRNAVAMGYIYDKATGVRTVTPQNINGNWNMNERLGVTIPFDKDQKIVLDNNVSHSYNHSVDLSGIDEAVGMTRSVVNTHNLSETLRFDWKLSEKYSFGAKGTLSYQHSTSDRQGFTDINSFDFNYGLTTQLELPWQMQISTDITMYSRRGYSDSTMNTNELVWNARLSKRMMKGNLTIMFDGFDILNKLSNVRRYINAQGRSETFYNVIPSYGLLHVIYRFNKKPKK